MKVTVIGAGYVGLVSAACLAELGHDVLCMDVDRQRIETLNSGRIPISEPGLELLIDRNRRQDRLRFDAAMAPAVAHGALLVIAVDTPPDDDGSADIHHVLAAARSIGQLMDTDKVVVDKSTAPVGTAERIRDVIRGELYRRQADFGITVVSNPEFLREGRAVEDFMAPDRIVVGLEGDAALGVMRTLYAQLPGVQQKLLVMDLHSAELAKYAANAMLATRISFMNEMALLAERLGADIEQVRLCVGSDPRIGPAFLQAGCGYGGSCLPKDVKALIRTAQEVGQPLSILQAVQSVNELQRHWLVDRVVERFGRDLSGRHFALWGLAFKPGTDDLREACSRLVVAGLLRRGATVAAYDPQAMPRAQQVFAGVAGLGYAGSALQALEGADALLIVTDWAEFRAPDFHRVLGLLKRPIVIDGRNLYEPGTMARLGFQYRAVGRPRQGAEAARPGAPNGAG